MHSICYIWISSMLGDAVVGVGSCWLARSPWWYWAGGGGGHETMMIDPVWGTGGAGLGRSWGGKTGIIISITHGYIAPSPAAMYPRTRCNLHHWIESEIEEKWSPWPSMAWIVFIYFFLSWQKQSFKVDIHPAFSRTCYSKDMITSNILFQMSG